MIMKADDQSEVTPDVIGSHGDEAQTFRRTQFRLGLRSLLGLGLAPLGRKAATFQRQLQDHNRLTHGLIIVLPGIEGCSSINDSIVRGFVEAELPHAIHVIDWRRFSIWNPLQLAMEQYNREQATMIVEKIRLYRNEFPDSPVHLVGHSAGAGMALFVLEALDAVPCIESVVLLAAAVSRDFHVAQLLRRTQRGIWNFYSALDLPTTGIGTMIVGTMDRRHAISAGALGFRSPEKLCGDAECLLERGPQLYQVAFRPGMIRSWNFGGHFGATNSVFVQRHIAPLLAKNHVETVSIKEAV
jgi:pimeloyl-ACP methyl ester carboxylesterase